ncbi:MAG: hypothetical protein ACLT76_11875 [Clostridium fessum]
MVVPECGCGSVGISGDDRGGGTARHYKRVAIAGGVASNSTPPGRARRDMWPAKRRASSFFPSVTDLLRRYTVRGDGFLARRRTAKDYNSCACAGSECGAKFGAG